MTVYDRLYNSSTISSLQKSRRNNNKKPQQAKAVLWGAAVAKQDEQQNAFRRWHATNTVQASPMNKKTTKSSVVTPTTTPRNTARSSRHTPPPHYNFHPNTTMMAPNHSPRRAVPIQTKLYCTLKDHPFFLLCPQTLHLTRTIRRFELNLLSREEVAHDIIEALFARDFSLPPSARQWASNPTSVIPRRNHANREYFSVERMVYSISTSLVLHSSPVKQNNHQYAKSTADIYFGQGEILVHEYKHYSSLRDGLDL